MKRVLDTGNIVACVGTLATNFADQTLTGGAATAISALYSVQSLISGAHRDQKGMARQMAQGLADRLAHMHLGHDDRRIAAQLVEQYQPSVTDIAHGDEDPAQIAANMADRIRARATDPEHKTDRALQHYTQVLTAILTPVLKVETIEDARQQDILRTVHKLEKMAKDSGDTQRLLSEGITEKAIIRLAQRIAGETDDLGQAWLELQNAMDIAVRVQHEGRTPSNHRDFVDQVLARVADLAAKGDYPAAGAAIADALEEEEARRAKLLDSGIEVALLEGDAEQAADYLIRKADLEAGGRADFGALRALFIDRYETGRDKGLALPLKVSIALAQRIHGIASAADEHGTALNDLGTALQTLGERESGTDKLQDAVTAYRDALKEYTRNRVPLDWARTQMNLGNALKTLGERESGTDKLQDAVTAYRDALKEYTRDRVPLGWAMTQMNLGNALQTLGERESGTDKLQDAVTAYQNALKERTRDRVPLGWAMTQGNLAILHLAFFDKTGEAARLDAASEAADAAKEVFEEAGASHYIEVADQIIAAIAKKRQATTG